MGVPIPTSRLFMAVFSGLFFLFPFVALYKLIVNLKSSKSDQLGKDK